MQEFDKVLYGKGVVVIEYNSLHYSWMLRTILIPRDAYIDSVFISLGIIHGFSY